MAYINIVCNLVYLLAILYIHFPVFCRGRYATFSLTKNTRIANATETYDVISDIICCRICISSDGCGMASYHQGSKICEIPTSSSVNRETTIIPEHGWTVYVRSAPECPEGWTSYGFSCYLLDFQLRTHTDAEVFCESHSAHLADIKTEEENGFVVTLLTQNLLPLTEKYAVSVGDITVRLGATTRGGESEYYWTDGTPLSTGYVNWGPNEPSNLDENCMAAFGTIDFKWVDIDCSRAEMSVCEK